MVGGSGLYSEVARSYPGQATSVLSGVLHAVVQAASTVCVGWLGYAAFVRVRTGPDRLRLQPRVDLSVATWSSLVWCSAATALVFVDAADANGLPLSRLLQPGAIGYLVQASYLPGAWLLVAGCAFAVFCVTLGARRWQAGAALAVVTALLTLPPVVVTQVLVGPNHDFGSDAAIIGVPAGTIWLGTLVAFAVRQRRGPFPGRLAARRIWTVSLACWITVLGCECVLAAFELVGTPLLSTPTAWLFLVRIVLLVACGPIVARGFRRSRSATGAASARWGVVALLVLLTLRAAAVLAMSRIPPPQYFVPTSVAQLYFGYNVTAAPTLAVLAFDWRVNILFATLSLAAMTAYLLGVRRLRRRGDAWPLGRTLCWLAGWTVVLVTTSSGLGRYSSASFSLHMVLHMCLNMLGPLLMVLGGPITLALRALDARPRSQAAGPHEWVGALLAWPLARVLYNPLFVFVRFISTYYILYFTPIFAQALRYHWAHQLMNVEFLTVGYLFYGIIIGVDPLPRTVPHIGKLGLVLAAMPFHAFFGVAVMTSRTVIAQLFYEYVDASWMHDLKADQYLGGGIAWAAGELPLILVIVALVTQWSRQDRRLATRTDRHLDSGVDDSWEVYNAMLARLAARRGEAPGPLEAPAPAVVREPAD